MTDLGLGNAEEIHHKGTKDTKGRIASANSASSVNAAEVFLFYVLFAVSFRFSPLMRAGFYRCFRSNLCLSTNWPPAYAGGSDRSSASEFIRSSTPGCWPSNCW